MRDLKSGGDRYGWEENSELVKAYRRYEAQDRVAELEAEFNALPWYTKSWWWVKMQFSRLIPRIF